LDRFGVEGDTTRNADELRRRKFLFEYVFFLLQTVDHVNVTPELSKGSRTSYNVCPKIPAPPSIRTKGT